MTDKDKQKEEFLDMADKKASRPIQVNAYFGEKPPLMTT
jgi:hypothetical protein